MPNKFAKKGNFKSAGNLLLVAGISLATMVLLVSSAFADSFVWTHRTGLGAAGSWVDVAASQDGTRIVAVQRGGLIQLSSDSGGTWANTGGYTWTGATMSGDAGVILLSSEDNYIYRSTNFGDSWITVNSGIPSNVSDVAISDDGAYAVAASSGSDVYYSADGGSYWAAASIGSYTWTSVAVSGNGQYMYATANGQDIYRSTNYGSSWSSATGLNYAWVSVDAAAGDYVVAAVRNGYIYMSSDNGSSWYALSGAGTRAWKSVSISGDGSRIVGVVDGGGVYVSTNYGSTWYQQTTLSSSGLWNGVVFSSDGYLIVLASSDNYLYTATPDGTAPTVSSVTSSTSNGAYKAGSAISIQVTFSERVIVSGGTPLLLLETGTTDRNASYVSGSGTDVLTFTYTVQAGDASSDLDYKSTSSMLSGGTITDEFGNAATRTLPTPGAEGSLGNAKDIVIDATAPVVSVTSPASSAYVSGTITFSASVTDANTAGVKFYGEEVLQGSEDTTSPYSISLDTTGFGDGPVILRAAARDTAGNYATSSISVTVDNTAPTILSASSTAAAGTYTAGDVIDIDVQFSEAVTSTGNVTVTLETGDTDRTCTFTISSATYGTCDYTVQDGDVSSDLDVSSITGTIADAAGNAVSGTTPASGFAANEAIVVDALAPSVSVSSPTTGATVSGSVSLAATASDASGVAGVQFYVDDVAEGAEDTTDTYGVAWDTSLVADGSHEIIAVARDENGNYATSTAVTVTVANTVASSGSGSSRSPSGYRTRVKTYAGPSGSSSGAGDGGNVSGAAPTTAISRDLQTGSRDAEVVALQRFLNAAGFTVAAEGPGAPGQETDFFGAATREALIRFQEARGIVPASGFLGPLTRAAIAAESGSGQPSGSGEPATPTRDLETGSRGGEVSALQRILIERLAGPAARALAEVGATGFFGSLTRAALAELQAALGIAPASGFFGPLTRAALGI